MLYAESPQLLLLEMLDLRALAIFAKKHKLVFVVDNTWGSGLSYQPLSLGGGCIYRLWYEVCWRSLI